MKSVPVFYITFLLLACFVAAHLDGGIDVPAGNYTIDIGYDTTHLVAGRSTVVLINLLDWNGSVESRTAWIRITDATMPVFIAQLAPEPTGLYSFTTQFSHGGTYALTMRFTTPSGPIEATTVLEVHSSWSRYLIFSIILVVLFGCITYIKIRKKIKT